MVTMSMYEAMLMTKGKNLSQVRQNQSRLVMNATFTGDVGYKRVYILSKDDGWKYEDAKYSKHTTPSILKDAVDYYLQFRPRIHYPVGTYVFIPNDEDYDIGFSELNPVDPFKDQNFILDKLWMIVGKNDANEFVRYNIIKCNWNFKWVQRLHGKNIIMNVYGAVRSANSYTSGVWRADYGYYLDNVTGFWIPDTHWVYGDKLLEYNLCDTRYISHKKRFMITNNQIDPKIYEVSKVLDVTPQGIIKMTVKQDELNVVRDNVELMICDYFEDNGEVKIETASGSDITKTSYIWTGHINSNGELEHDYVSQEIRDRDYNKLTLGQYAYFIVEYYGDNNNIVTYGIDPEWRISLVNDQNYSPEEIIRFEKLVKVEQIDHYVVSVKASKAYDLIGKKFILSVQQASGEYSSSIMLEVQG